MISENHNHYHLFSYNGISMMGFMLLIVFNFKHITKIHAENMINIVYWFSNAFQNTVVLHITSIN